MEFATSLAAEKAVPAGAEKDLVSETDTLIVPGKFSGHTTSDLKGFEVATMVRKFAKKETSAALAQLASRISVS